MVVSLVYDIDIEDRISKTSGSQSGESDENRDENETEALVDDTNLDSDSSSSSSSESDLLSLPIPIETPDVINQDNTPIAIPDENVTESSEETSESSSSSSEEDKKTDYGALPEAEMLAIYAQHCRINLTPLFKGQLDCLDREKKLEQAKLAGWSQYDTNLPDTYNYNGRVVSSWENMMLRSDLLAGIGSCGYSAPSPIQARLVPAIIHNTSSIIVEGSCGCGTSTALYISILRK